MEQNETAELTMKQEKRIAEELCRQVEEQYGVKAVLRESEPPASPSSLSPQNS
ncbi:MAG: hypothetical protein K1W13_02535 [Lachnospiraceae bacterium]